MTTATTGSADTSGYPDAGRVGGPDVLRPGRGDPRAEPLRFPAWTGWASVTWAQAAETVQTMAAGLLALGILLGSYTRSWQ